MATDPTTTTNPVSTIEADVKSVLARIQALASRYFTHAAGQVVAWLVLETHHVSSVEAGITTSATLALTSVLKRISTWLKA